MFESYISFLIEHEHELTAPIKDHLRHYHLYDLDTKERIKSIDILEYNSSDKCCYKYYENEKYDIETYDIFAVVKEAFLKNVIVLLKNFTVQSSFSYFYLKDNKRINLPIDNIDEDKLRLFGKIADSYKTLYSL